MALVFAFGELANYQRFVFIRATTNCMPGPRGPGFLFTCPPPKLLENRRLVHRVRATRLVGKVSRPRSGTKELFGDRSRQIPHPLLNRSAYFNTMRRRPLVGPIFLSH